MSARRVPLISYLLPAMLSSFFARPAAPALAQVARYRGCAAGWQRIGSPRPVADAERLIATWQRIAPTATLRALPA